MATREQKLASKLRQADKNEDDKYFPTFVSTPAAPSAPTAPSIPAPSTAPSSTATVASVPLKPSTDAMSFASLANALLPYFSGQDQAAVSTFLNTQDPTGVFKDYLNNIQVGPHRAETAKQFLSADRARDALSKLDIMRTAAGLTEEQLGSGYKFIRQAINLLATLGISTGEQGMTRAEFENMQAQLSAINEQARSDKSLAPYAELATKFINPTLIGTLYPASNINGRPVYGQSNKKLY